MIRFLSILLLSALAVIGQGTRTVMIYTNTGILNPGGRLPSGVYPNITQFASDEQDISSRDPKQGRFLISLTQPVSGFWVWDDSSTATTGDGVIDVNGYAVGRWIRQFSATTAPTLDSSRGVVINANKRTVSSTATKQQIDNTAMNVATIAALKALNTNINSGQVIIVGGYYANGDGGGGQFWYDGSDTTSSDDGGSVIVSTSGGLRYKRIFSEAVTPLQFGAYGNGTSNDATAWTAAILYAKRGSTNSNLGLRTVDGLGLRYRLTARIGSLATDGYGVGVAIVNASFVQATANTPILAWDIASTTNLVSGDSGWNFQNLTFNWASNPAPGESNAVAFYLAAPNITNAARDYSIIYNSTFRDLTFNNAHTGFRSYGKSVIWGCEFSNLRWYGGCVGPLIDWSQPRQCQASSPGNQFRLIYARVDGFTDSSAGGNFIQLNTQRDCLIDGVEFNLARTNITTYLRIDQPQNLSIRNVRLENNSSTAGGWAPNYDGFISLVGAISAIRIEGLSFQTVTVNGQGALVRLPASSTAVESSVTGLSLDSVTVASGALWGIASTSGGASGDMSPIVQLSCSGTIGQFFPYDTTSTLWGIRRATRFRTSADRGDASVTLVPGVDAGIQRFNTALTANRTITLGGSFTAGTVANGDEFVIVRTDTASFTLNVGGLVTFASGQGGTVRVRWVADGSSGGAWTLIDDDRARSISGTVTITAQTVTALSTYSATAAVASASFSGDRYTWALPNGVGGAPFVVWAETASAGNAIIRFYNPTAVSQTLPAQTITITKLFP
jgi:hypothetical protein